MFDDRTRTLWQFARIVRDLRPTGFLFENVPALTFEPSLPLLKRFLRSLSRLGYGVNWRVINSLSFGVPQKRERLFVVGLRNHQVFDFPEPTRKPNEYASAGDALRNLYSFPEDGENVAGKWGHLLCKIPPGKNYLYLAKTRGGRRAVFRWRSRYWSFLLKLSSKLPSWTIQASPGPYVGPFHWKNRRLRIPEVKRLQTFPDEYVLAGDRRSAWAQLGDATPPLLASNLFDALGKQAA
jgi:DNA (cytosine-5)-methyltransferase 1